MQLSLTSLRARVLAGFVALSALSTIVVVLALRAPAGAATDVAPPSLSAYTHAADHAYITPKGTAVAVVGPGLYQGGTSVAGPLVGTPVLDILAPPRAGFLSQPASDGAFRYLPNAAFVGTDSFQYCFALFSDSSHLQCVSNAATVTIAVTGSGGAGSPNQPRSSTAVTPSSPPAIATPASPAITGEPGRRSLAFAGTDVAALLALALLLSVAGAVLVQATSSGTPS